ncbi:MAG: VWA domain-containing protein [Phycisphaerae bacterium]|jgi:Ca-activated chloride channel family protein
MVEESAVVVSPDFFNLSNPEALRWLWLLVPLAILFAVDLRRRTRVLRLFVSRSLLDDVSPRRSWSRPIVRFCVFLLGATALVFALARPQWAPKEVELEQQGQNILFLLDVSNSMRARDVDPSRLEAAKAAVASLVARLPAGNQVGLLAYAGDAELKCPLTPNYTHFQSVLQRVSFNSVDVGGSNLGDAIYKATHDVFGLTRDAAAQGTAAAAQGEPAIGDTVMTDEGKPEEESANVLIVLTDGENHEGHAREMALEAHRLGVGMYLIGFGSREGAPIPIEIDGRIEMLKHKGTEVITRLDDESLRTVIEDIPSRRGYLAAGTANVDLADVYERVISKQGTQKKRLRFTVWQEKFQLFAGLGMALVLFSWLISEQKPARRLEAST